MAAVLLLKAAAGRVAAGVSEQLGRYEQLGNWRRHLTPEHSLFFNQPASHSLIRSKQKQLIFFITATNKAGEKKLFQGSFLAISRIP